MTSEFLSLNEVSQLTEYTSSAHQRQQLQDMGVKFVVSRSGKPIVSRQAVRQLLGCKGGKTATSQQFEPNLED